MEILLLSFPKLGWDMCSYIIFLYHHQYVCPEIFVALNEERGGCFHHDISAVENTSGQMDFTDDCGLLLDSCTNGRQRWCD